MRSPSLHAGPTISALALKDLCRRTAGPLRSRAGAAVLQVADVEDVTVAVRWAVTACVQVDDRLPTGSGPDAPGALFLDLARLDHVSVDLGRQVARVGAGVSVGDLASALSGTGLIFVGVPDPGAGVVRSALTGGLGWFGRSLGLACDGVVGADVVDGLGRVRHVDAGSDPDLFWALRGGGPGLGLVVALEVALHAVPHLQAGRLSWRAGSAAEVLGTFREVCAGAPDRLTVWFDVRPGAVSPPVAVAVVCLDDAAGTADLLAPLRTVPGLLADTVVGVPAESVLSRPPAPGPVSPGVRGALAEGLDDELVSRLVAAVRTGSGHSPADGSPTTPGVQVAQLGGALGRPSSRGGCHGVVTEPFVLPAEALRSSAPGRSARTLPDVVAGDDEGAWFDAATRARLSAIKQEVDPIDTVRGPRHRD